MTEVIDMHVYFGAPKDPQSGCYWSEKFERTKAYLSMKLTSGTLFIKLTMNRIKKHWINQLWKKQVWELR